jgi:hypothetical protein
MPLFSRESFFIPIYSSCLVFSDFDDRHLIFEGFTESFISHGINRFPGRLLFGKRQNEIIHEQYVSLLTKTETIRHTLFVQGVICIPE